MVISGLTLIESKSWTDIRKKVYLPHDADEYRTCSRSLTTLSHNVFKRSCSQEDKPLKMGYLVDVCRNGSVTPCALILGLIYLKRLSVINPDYLSQVTSSNLFLIAMVVASKYLQDEGELEALVNSEWAEIGQRSKSKLDMLERDFLEAIDWQLFVSPQEYYSFAARVGAEISCTEAKSRGWWSYTDLIGLWNASDTSSTVTTTAKQVSKAMSASLAIYLFTVTALLSTSPSPSAMSSTTAVLDTRPSPILEVTSKDGVWCNDITFKEKILGNCTLDDNTRHCILLEELELFRSIDGGGGGGEGNITLLKGPDTNDVTTCMYMMNSLKTNKTRASVDNWPPSCIDRGKDLFGFGGLSFMNLFTYSHNA